VSIVYHNTPLTKALDLPCCIFNRYVCSKLQEVYLWDIFCEHCSSQVAVNKELNICRIWGSHTGGYEEYHLPGYNAVWAVECQPTFRRNMSPSSSESKKISWARTPEYGGDMFLRNVGWHPMDHTAFYPGRQYSSTIYMFSCFNPMVVLVLQSYPLKAWPVKLKFSDKFEYRAWKPSGEMTN
jgi:hypothetical protein